MVDRTSGEPDPSSLTQLSRAGWCEWRHRMWHSVADSIASAESTFRYHHPTDWWWHGGLQGSGSSDHSNDDLVLRLFTGCFPTTGPDGIWQNQMYSSWRFNSTSEGFFHHFAWRLEWHLVMGEFQPVLVSILALFRGTVCGAVVTWSYPHAVIDSRGHQQQQNTTEWCKSAH